MIYSVPLFVIFSAENLRLNREIYKKLNWKENVYKHKRKISNDHNSHRMPNILRKAFISSSSAEKIKAKNLFGATFSTVGRIINAAEQLKRTKLYKNTTLN